MNILIVNGYVRENKGDAALMSVLCDELQKTYPAADIAISSQEDPAELPRFEQWRNVGSLNRYCFDPAMGKARHLLRVLLSVCAVVALGVLPRRAARMATWLLPRPLRLQLRTLVDADMVAAMGGGYLNGDASLMADVCVFFMLAPLKLAKHLGICAVCAPQSMGPFATRFQQRMAVRTLKKIDLLLVREQKTAALLAALSPELPVALSADSGFLFTSAETPRLRRQLKADRRLLVGVTVRRWLDANRQRTYERAVAATIDHLTQQHKAVVVLIPQVTSGLGGDDDRLTAQQVYGHVQHKHHVTVLIDDYSHHEIKALYNDLDIIIGTRFHSVIFSLTSMVPALAIEYEHKTSGIMRELGLDKWVVKIEEATAEVLTGKIDQLIAVRHQYKAHLQKALPPYIAKAQGAITLIKRAYKTHADRS